MADPTAVLFDLDGLLIDSEPFWQEAELAELAAVGLRPTAADLARTTGLRIDEVVAQHFARSPWVGPSVAEVAARIVGRVVGAIGAHGRALPGAEQALALARSRADRVGLATSSPSAVVRAVVARLGLEGVFDAVASAEVEAHGKPHPAVYLSLARVLGVRPARCVAVEDSLNGLVAARAARMRCVVVPDPAHRDDPRFVWADLRLGSLVELDGERLDGLLAEQP